jgi:hypothetical protein
MFPNIPFPFPWMLKVVTFASNKCFDQVDIGQGKLEGNSEAERKGEALNIIIPIIYGTSMPHV